MITAYLRELLISERMVLKNRTLSIMIKKLTAFTFRFHLNCAPVLRDDWLDTSYTWCSHKVLHLDSFALPEIIARFDKKATNKFIRCWDFIWSEERIRYLQETKDWAQIIFFQLENFEQLHLSLSKCPACRMEYISESKP